jgi:hypothetical protein
LVCREQQRWYLGAARLVLTDTVVAAEMIRAFDVVRYLGMPSLNWSITPIGIFPSASSAFYFTHVLRCRGRSRNILVI